jgi:hypothetical protein
VLLEDVPRVRTPSGGVHFYFKANASYQVRNSAGRLATGVDVRADGGFVIVAGATRADGVAYTPLHPDMLDDFIKTIKGGHLPLFPAAIAERALRPMNPVSSNNVVPFVRSPGLADLDNGEVGKGRWSLDEACARISSASPGTRNDTLNREAFIAGLRVAEGMFQPAEAAAQLASAAEAAGLAPEEIEKTIDGALQRVAYLKCGAAPNFDRTKTGTIKGCFKNAMAALRELGIVARRNTFSDKIVLSNATGSSILAPEHEGLLSDNALTLIRTRIQQNFGFDSGKDHLLDGIKAIAEEARFDPVNDYLDSLEWDGTRRLSTWLPNVTGAPATPLFEASGRVLILSLTMRARYPGSKADSCSVLEGPQGCRKSSLARAICSGPGDTYFCDVPGLIAMDNKARGELLAGKWLVELAELSGMAKSETEGVKAFISQSSDQYRPAYGTVAVDRPRTCIFIATTNASAYLPDATGNRRFLPIPCNKIIDVTGFLRDRDQLFAEAVVVLDDLVRRSQISCKRGQPLPHSVAVRLGLDPQHWAAAAALADDRRVTDPVEDVLPLVIQSLEPAAQNLPNGRKFIASSALLERLRLQLGAPVRKNGLANWMSVLGWSPTKKGSGAQQVRGYEK